MITKIKQWWNSVQFILSFLSSNVSVFGVREPLVLYIADGIAESKELVNEIVERARVNIKYTEVESEANILLRTRTETFGFMFTDNKLNLFIPLRNESNNAMVDFCIINFVKLLDLLGEK